MNKLDDDGYPTEEFLESIRTWEVKNVEDAKEWMEHIRRGWFYSDYFDDSTVDDVTVYHVSTGGWSGHEDTIEAMKENFFGWYHVWYSTRRGGHYEFRLEK